MYLSSTNMNDINVNKYIQQGETIDDLQIQNLMIFQKENAFRFGTDAVVLANYAAQTIHKGKRVLDIGTGTGIIPLLLSAKTGAKQFVGVEIQESIAEMATRSVAYNVARGYLDADRIQIVQGDIKALSHDRTWYGQFDYVVTNPPYFKLGTGYVNDQDALLLARHEVKCTLDDIIKAASVMLRPKGTFFMINKPERLADTIELMRKHTVEPKEIQFVYADISQRPVMFLVKGIRDGGRQLIVEKGLVIN